MFNRIFSQKLKVYKFYIQTKKLSINKHLSSLPFYKQKKMCLYLWLWKTFNMEV